MATRTEVVTMHICSDGQSFQDAALAEEHEALVALRGACDACTQTTAMAVDVYDTLHTYPDLFLKALTDYVKARAKAHGLTREPSR